jgi:hypothetical protein
MPEKPQVLEGHQDLEEDRRLGEREESATRGFESLILERDCTKMLYGLAARQTLRNYLSLCCVLYSFPVNG